MSIDSRTLSWRQGQVKTQAGEEVRLDEPGASAPSHLPSHTWPDFIIGVPKETFSVMIYLPQ